MRAVTVTRALRAFAAFWLAWNLVLGILNGIAGHGTAFVSFACVLFLAGVMTFQTVIIRRIEKDQPHRDGLPAATLRRIARRPHPDYARIADLERELGMEPSEPCMPVKVPAAVEGKAAAAKRRAVREAAAAKTAGRTPRRCAEPDHYYREAQDYAREVIQADEIRALVAARKDGHADGHTWCIACQRMVRYADWAAHVDHSQAIVNRRRGSTNTVHFSGAGDGTPPTGGGGGGSSGSVNFVPREELEQWLDKERWGQ